jgi:hypothetical protein
MLKHEDHRGLKSKNNAIVALINFAKGEIRVQYRLMTTLTKL